MDGARQSGGVLHRQVFAEELHLVAGGSPQPGGIRHAHVHADTAYNRRPLSADEHLQPVGAQPGQAVGIADGQGGQLGVPLQHMGTAIAYRRPGGDGLDRGYPGLKRHYRPQANAVQPLAGGVGIVAVQGHPGAHHIQMSTGIL